MTTPQVPEKAVLTEPPKLARVEQREDGPWLVMTCPKWGFCKVPVSREPPNEDAVRGRVWQWVGSAESPTIVPSIGCDNAPRCGQHRVITEGTWK